MLQKNDAREQLNRAEARGWLPLFIEAGRVNDVPPGLLLAIASRETWIGDPWLVGPSFTGDNGHGRGIMQIDDRYHSSYTNYHANDDHAANIGYAAWYLRSLLDQFNGEWVEAVAAYNAGPRNVIESIEAGGHPDDQTTGGDYSQDVFSRYRTITDLADEYEVLTRANVGPNRLPYEPFDDTMGLAAFGGWPTVLMLVFGLALVLSSVVK